jgi:hypothetical protein
MHPRVTWTLCWRSLPRQTLVQRRWCQSHTRTIVPGQSSRADLQHWRPVTQHDGYQVAHVQVWSVLEHHLAHLAFPNSAPFMRLCIVKLSCLARLADLSRIACSHQSIAIGATSSVSGTLSLPLSVVQSRVPRMLECVYGASSRS